MKKILTLTAAFISVFSTTSCNNDQGSSPVFRVRPETITFGRDSKEPQIIDVITSSDVNWEAEVDAEAQDWLTITTEADKVIVSVAENTTDEERAGKIIIKPSNDAFQDVEINVLQTTVRIIDIVPTKAMLLFDGNYYETGLSNYYLRMGSGDAECVIKEGINSDIEVVNGYYLHFEIFTEEITHQDYQKIDLKEGIYKSSLHPWDEDFVFEEMSFIITTMQDERTIIFIGFSMIVKYENGNIVERFIISDGEIAVKHDNNDYTVTARLITDDGEIINVNYSGELDAKLNIVSYSTYTSDLTLSSLNEGSLEFYGEEDHPDCFRWVVRIDVPGYDNVSELILTLFSTTTSTITPESGAYNISEIYPYVPGIAENGWGWDYDEIIGTWVLGYKDGALTKYSPIIEGTVSVTHNGGDNYTIGVDALMDNYYKVNASFEGDLEYIDMTEPEP